MRTQIGRYEILKRLGTGGSGHLFLGRDSRTDVLVAIKTHGEAADVRERFAREADLQARVSHRNVVRVFEAGVDDGLAFIATEYVAGESLGMLLRRDPPVPLGDRLALVEQLCEGLAQIHAAGVVHGDITPANLLVSTDGTLKIAAFGRARLGSEADTPERVGTPAYVAPEQLEGGPVDFRSDLFAVGAVLYEAVALVPPFAPGESHGESHGAERSPKDSPIPLSSRVAGVDPQVARIVANAMERSPNRRYPSAEHLRRDVVNARLRLAAPAGTFSAGGGAEPDPRHIPAESSGPPPPGPAAASTPAASAGGADETAAQRRAAAMARALAASRDALDAGDLEAALDAAEQAAALDPSHALARDSIERVTLAMARSREEDRRRAHEAERREHDEHEARRRLERSRAEQEAERAREEERRREHAHEETRLEAIAIQRRRAEEEERRRRSPARQAPAGIGSPAPRQTDHGNVVPAVDDVQFTVYRPKAIRPATASPMFVFTHLIDARDSRSQPAPIEEVRKRIAEVLGPAAPAFRESMAEGRHGVPAGGQITLLPEMQGVTFTPARHAFRWELDIHEHRFEMEAARALDGQVARGQLTVYLGAILLAEVPLAIRVDSTIHDEADQAQERSTARAYRKIFASYSRKDSGVVEQFERYVEALGDSYLRDVRNLRAGERWEDGLRRLIEEADVFQLFWSWNAMRSPNVRREWEYAMSLNRPAFVRPTYWETPLPESAAEGLPPAALRQLHFHRMVAAVDAESADDADQDDPPGAVGVRESASRAAEDEDTGPLRWPTIEPAREIDPTSIAAARPMPGPRPVPMGVPSPAPPAAVRPAARAGAFRFIGVAAGVMLAAITGTLVWQTGMLRQATPSEVAVPAENPSPTTAGRGDPTPPPPTPRQPVPSPPVPPSVPTARGTPSEVIPAPPQPPPPSGTEPGDTGPAADVAAVRLVLERFERAYRARDAAAIRRLWPSAPGNLSAALSSVRDYEVRIRSPRISVAGNAATVSATRDIRIQPASGAPQETTTPTTFTLERGPDGWRITDVR